MKWFTFNALTKGFTDMRLACFFLDISRVIFLGALSKPATAQPTSAYTQASSECSQSQASAVPLQRDSSAVTERTNDVAKLAVTAASFMGLDNDCLAASIAATQNNNNTTGLDAVHTKAQDKQSTSRCNDKQMANSHTTRGFTPQTS
jgi:hypothetical protein